MGTRDRVALAVPSFLLRVVLGATLLWAGLGKLVPTSPFQPAELAVLANMGVTIPSPGGAAAPAPVPVPVPEEEPLPPVTEPAEELEPQAKSGYGLMLAQATPRTFAPSDFAEPVEMRRVYKIALLVHGAGHPRALEDGSVPMALAPPGAVIGNRPVLLAFAAMWTEIAVGVLLIVGLLVRLCGLTAAIVMCSAMWLTQIGPAVQAKTATWGFLPSPGIFELNSIGAYAWATFLWQAALIAMGLALLFGGAGMLSLDRLLFGKPRPADDDD